MGFNILDSTGSGDELKKFGEVIGMSSGVETDVWAIGPTQPVYIFPAIAGETVELISDNVGDVGQSLTVNGLDGDGLEKSEVVSSNGTTAVPLSGTWSSVHRIANTGSTSFAGNVQVQGDGVTSTNIFAVAPANHQQTMQAIYKVPSNKWLKLIDLTISMGRDAVQAGSVEFILKINSGESTVLRTNQNYTLGKEGASFAYVPFPLKVVVTPGASIKVTATPSAGSMNCTARFTGNLVSI